MDQITPQSARCRVPAALIFVLSGLIGTAVAVVSGYFFYDYVFNALQEFAIQQGQSQVKAVASRIFSISNLGPSLLTSYAYELQVRGNLFSFPNSSLSLDSAMFIFFAAAATQRRSVEGISMTLLNPPGAASAADATSMYQTGLIAIQLSANGTRFWTSNITNKEGTIVEIRHVTFSDAAYENIVIDPNPINQDTMPLSSFRDVTLGSSEQLGVTSASTGFSFFTADSQLVFRVRQNLQLCVIRIVQNLLSWYNVTQSVGLVGNPTLIVVDPISRAVIATSLNSELVRQQNCYGSRAEFVADGGACMRMPFSSNPDARIRELVGAVYSPQWAVINANVSTNSREYSLSVGSYYIISTQLFSNDKFRPFLVWARPSDDVFGSLRRTTIIILVVSSLCILIGTVIIAACTATALVRPMKAIEERMNQLANLDINDVDPAPQSSFVIREVDELESQFGAMASALLSFSKYVPRDVVRQLIADKDIARIGMQTKQLVAVIFCDIADFTTMCEKLRGDPQLISTLLERFFDEATTTLLKHSATIDKFIGDCIMCFWSMDRANQSHPCLSAICAGLDLFQTVKKLQETFQQNQTDLHIRVGCHAGTALVGNIGSTDRINYTVMGDTVNAAARLEGSNKQFFSNFMVSQFVLESALKIAPLAAKYLGVVKVKSRENTQLAVYHMIGTAMRLSYIRGYDMPSELVDIQQSVTPPAHSLLHQLDPMAEMPQLVQTPSFNVALYEDLPTTIPSVRAWCFVFSCVIAELPRTLVPVRRLRTFFERQLGASDELHEEESTFMKIAVRDLRNREAEAVPVVASASVSTIASEST